MLRCSFAFPIPAARRPALAPTLLPISPTTPLRIRQRQSRAARMPGPMAKSSVHGVEWLAEPVLVKGLVQRGFGRGSRDLGTPTANLPGAVLDGVALTARDGVYVGFGSVPEHARAPMKFVANLGRNITYGDVRERVLEAFLMGDGGLPHEFYGSEMRLVIAGYLRPELKFDSLDALIAGIRNDVAVAGAVLDAPCAARYRDVAFLGGSAE